MESVIEFGPREKTPQQRQALFDQAAALNATQDRKMEPFAEQLCQRYIAGEITLNQVITQVQETHRRTHLGESQSVGVAAPEAAPAPVLTRKRLFTH